ncbi:hypothetical protein LPB67_15760 [Undibacterium sp. Jales W-56]|uniref:hypothetical protein n=1 Tax=Undibacterium sp. Jales W-56 TaxID=2897325 RepID=UPI0021D16E22|nr:hypothetical protein [Undibacterium sp. Jales W-56]MCU6435231.1 hypothetical protein [Undibacterium sp. Jales W-56]
MFSTASPYRQGRPVSVLLGGSGIDQTFERKLPVLGALLKPSTGDVCRSMQEHGISMRCEIAHGD